MPPITIVYTQPGCGPCTAVKRKLKKLDVTYEERDVTEDEEYADQVRNLGYAGTPVVVLPDGTSWSGYRPGRIRDIHQGG